MTRKALVCFIPAAQAATATLDPVNNFGQALSNGNLTATAITGTNYANSSRTVTSHSSGKYYFECTNTNGVGGFGVGIMFLDSSYVFGTDLAFNSSHAVTFYSNGLIWFNGSNINYGIAWGNAGEVTAIAVNLDAQLLWVRGAGPSNWNGDGTADPATNTNGYSFTLGATLYGGETAQFFNSGSGDAVAVMNFGAAAYTYTPPVGYGNW